MKTFKEEIQSCLKETGKNQRALALASGVPAPTICTLLSGKRKNIYGTTLEKLRAGMQKLRDSYRASSVDPGMSGHTQATVTPQLSSADATASDLVSPR